MHTFFQTYKCLQLFFFSYQYGKTKIPVLQSISSVSIKRWCSMFQKAKDIPELADGF